MLNSVEMERLYKEHGSTIRKAAAYAAKRARLKFGYAIVDPDDLAANVLLTLVTKGHGCEFLASLEGKDAATLWIRKTTQFRTFELIRERIGTEASPVTVADFEGSDPGDPEGSAMPTWAWATDSLAYSVQASEDEFLKDLTTRQTLEHLAAVSDLAYAIVERIIAKAASALQREYLDLFYKWGWTYDEIAAKKGTSKKATEANMRRARAALSGTEIASLAAYRKAYYPDTRMQQTNADPKEMQHAIG